MSGKAERTTHYIVETVAPIFNKHGYIGTSLSHLTEATGLTKGAIYGNFENKLALALAALKRNRELFFEHIDPILNTDQPARSRLSQLLNFYKNYDAFAETLGGCPLINAGIDAQHNNAIIAAATKEWLRELEGKIAGVIEQGISRGEFTVSLPPLPFARQFLTLIMGAISMFTITGDHKYLVNTTNYINLLLDRELNGNVG